MASTNRTVPILFISVFMAIGCVPLVMGIRQVQRARESLSWPTVEGRIVRSGVRTEQRTERDDDGHQQTTTYHYADLSYEYAVDGQPFTGTRITVNEGQSGSEADARATSERYPVDAKVTVAYAPNSPDQAVLEPGKWGSAGFLLLFGGVFIGVPGLMLLAMFRGPKVELEEKRKAQEKADAGRLHGIVFKERILEWQPGSRVHLHRDHETFTTIVIGSIFVGLFFGVFLGAVPAGIFFFSRFGLMFVVKAYFIVATILGLAFGIFFGIEHRRRDTVIDWGFHTVRAQVGWRVRQYAFNQIEGLIYRAPPKKTSDDSQSMLAATIELNVEGCKYKILETEVSRQQAAFLRDKLLPILEPLSAELGVPWSEQEKTSPLTRFSSAPKPYAGEDRELVEAIGKVGGRVVHRNNEVYEVDLTEVAGTDGIVEIVSNFTDLCRLEMKGKGITDECVKYLTSLTELCVLTLESTSLTDAGVIGLGKLRELESLSLKGTRIRSTAMQLVEALPNLEELDLAYTAIDDDVLTYLADCEKLSYLDLTGTQVTPPAVAELQKRLPDCVIETDDCASAEPE